MRKIFAFIAMMLLAVCPKAMAEETTSEKEIAWSATANYNSEALNKDFDSKIVAYTDGFYAIKGVYGSEYDIEFTVDSESVIDGTPEVVFTNAYYAAAPYYYFYGGDYKICIYYAKGAGYSGWEGDTEEPGVWYYVYLYDKDDNYLGGGWDYITWSKDDIVVPVEKKESWSATANYNSEALNKNFDSKIVAYTDGTYAIKGVYGSEYDIEFTVDSESVIDGTPEVVFTNAYYAAAPYYYFYGGDYKICIYYAKGAGYSGWEGDTEEPGVWYYVYLYDKDDNYLGGGWDYITWSAPEVTTISTVKAESASNRITGITGIDYGKASKLPAGLYLKNGKKFIAR